MASIRLRRSAVTALALIIAAATALLVLAGPKPAYAAQLTQINNFEQPRQPRDVPLRVDQAAAGFRATLVGYWVVGLPVSGLLAFGLGWSLAGLWTGLGCGLAASAALMLSRFRTATRAVVRV